MKAVPVSRYVAFLAIASIGCLVDLATKAWAFRTLGMPGGRVQWVWSPYVGFQTSLNEGALFGMGQGMVPVFVVLSAVAMLGILYWLFVAGNGQQWWLTITLGAISAGILGNLYDRLGMHQLRWNYPFDRVGQPVYAVRDWILFQANHDLRWPNFNIADSLLVCGAALLAWHAIFMDEGQTSSD